MKQDYTDINIVLDRSGSMQSIKDDTIGGFNAFLAEQKDVPGAATITLAQFDDVYEVVYEALILSQAPELTGKTFVPRGSTALLDAIGRTINTTGARLAAMDEASRPSHVIFVILTDGAENASQEFNAVQINQMIQHQRDTYNWEFVFLGANQDAITTAGRLGIQAGNAMSYAASSVGTRAAFKSVAKNMAKMRVNAAPSMAFEEVDRVAQRDAGVEQNMPDAPPRKVQASLKQKTSRQPRKR
ncbi:VWA domain-containing protein [filamentous cyanobacterium LEGE 11480]|uniref:VWA domain-containing protein n=1 Tax=Romeriopsis navalis LEGE 11480 TaxID=2777977 RepID=A0A928VTC0_9CYAN|nr:vWA domain-containing protein [Romeriopsis navalis]MBE9031859.1 VWA domain-containing protein [Romeriopsis navalis LEGE 11480]